MDKMEARKVRSMVDAFDEIEGHAHLLELKLKCQQALNPEAAPITLQDVIVLLANINQARRKFKAAATELRRYERGEIELFQEQDEADNGKPVRVYRRKRQY
jgi:hypothetical protein